MNISSNSMDTKDSISFSDSDSWTDRKVLTTVRIDQDNPQWPHGESKQTPSHLHLSTMTSCSVKASIERTPSPMQKEHLTCQADSAHTPPSMGEMQFSLPLNIPATESHSRGIYPS